MPISRPVDVRAVPRQAPGQLRDARTGRGHVGAERADDRRDRRSSSRRTLITRGAGEDVLQLAQEEQERTDGRSCSTRPTAFSTCSCATSTPRTRRTATRTPTEHASAIRDLYVRMDGLLARVMEHVDDRTLLLRHLGPRLQAVQARRQPQHVGARERLHEGGERRRCGRERLRLGLRGARAGRLAGRRGLRLRRLLRRRPGRDERHRRVPAGRGLVADEGLSAGSLRHLHQQEGPRGTGRRSVERLQGTQDARSRRSSRVSRTRTPARSPSRPSTTPRRS